MDKVIITLILYLSHLVIYLISYYFTVIFCQQK